MANPVNWFQISGKHAEPLIEFYGKAFDWQLKPGPGGMTFVSPAEGGIPGGIAATQDGSENNVAIYVGVDDIEAALARIEHAGGRPVMQRMELPDGMGAIAGFLDPAGNWIGLWQPGPAMAKPPAAAAAPKKTAKRRAPAKKAAAKKTAAKKTAAKKTAAKKTAAKKTAKKPAKKTAKKR